MLAGGTRMMFAFVMCFTRVFVMGFAAMFAPTCAPGFGAAGIW